MLIWIASAMAQEPEDFRGYRDQARFFVKKEWYSDALEQLELAVETEDGQLDAESWHLLAKVRYELCDLRGARRAAAKAHSFSTDDTELRDAYAFSAFLHDQFGIVTIDSPFPGAAVRLNIELKSILFDAEQKRYIRQLERLYKARKVSLPHELGLPAGSYVINGDEVVLEGGGWTDLKLDEGKTATARLPSLELSMGVGGWMGDDVENHLPAFGAQISLTEPVGRVALGLVVDLGPTAFRTADGDVYTNLSASLGGRIGWLWQDADPVLVRASIGYRFAFVPGIELGCAGGQPLACSSGAADLILYGNGTAHVPFLELAALYVDQSRTTALGIGVKTVVEHAFGRLPATAEARNVTSGTMVPYDIADDSRHWQATGLRLLADFSIAF